MHDHRDDYEPIIATRRTLRPEPENRRSLWPALLALTAGLAVVAFLAWWFLGRPSPDEATALQSPAPETFPEIQIEEDPALPARDPEPAAAVAKDSAPPARDSSIGTDVAEVPVSPSAADESAGAAQATTPAGISEGAPDSAIQVPDAPASVQVRLVSSDAQVRFEVHSQVDSTPPATGKAGDVIDVAPGTYRVVASGAQLETLERQVAFDDVGALEYTVELCAERKRERESLAGQVVEERACASAAQCESLFMILGEEADQLVKDRDFRTEQCAKWRVNALPEGTWTLDTRCGGATAASTCRIEIAAGICSFAEPPRTLRGTACPRAEIR